MQIKHQIIRTSWITQTVSAAKHPKVFLLKVFCFTFAFAEYSREGMDFDLMHL